MSACCSATTALPEAPKESDAAEAPAGASIKTQNTNRKILRMGFTIADGYMKLVLLRKRAGGEAYQKDAYGIKCVGYGEEAARGHFGNAEEREPQLVRKRACDDERAHKREHPAEALAVKYFKEARRAVALDKVGKVVAEAVAHKRKDEVVAAHCPRPADERHQKEVAVE